ncbi:MAG: hypothetical protein HC833_00030 [Leptolyngbyaceae cyanobacterium RM1_406_9]|nr:hypothetical protein [Leptolyngbyaceae cyanobacterium RM1_406_9]
MTRTAGVAGCPTGLSRVRIAELSRHGFEFGNKICHFSSSRTTTSQAASVNLKAWEKFTPQCIQFNLSCCSRVRAIALPELQHNPFVLPDEFIVKSSALTE